MTRSALFLQTKFTYQRGQDDRLPYKPDADLSTQVAQSMAKLLDHLGTDYVDNGRCTGLLRKPVGRMTMPRSGSRW